MHTPNTGDPAMPWAMKPAPVRVGRGRGGFERNAKSVVDRVSAAGIPATTRTPCRSRRRTVIWAPVSMGSPVAPESAEAKRNPVGLRRRGMNQIVLLITNPTAARHHHLHDDGHHEGDDATNGDVTEVHGSARVNIQACRKLFWQGLPMRPDRSGRSGTPRKDSSGCRCAGLARLSTVTHARTRTLAITRHSRCRAPGKLVQRSGRRIFGTGFRTELY